MAEFTKGETAGGWIYILRGKLPVALVHPKHIDRFIASDDMYEALKALEEYGMKYPCGVPFRDKIKIALAKAEGK